MALMLGQCWKAQHTRTNDSCLDDKPSKGHKGAFEDCTGYAKKQGRSSPKAIGFEVEDRVFLKVSLMK